LISGRDSVLAPRTPAFFAERLHGFVKHGFSAFNFILCGGGPEQLEKLRPRFDVRSHEPLPVPSLGRRVVVAHF
jgi:hypothetical protein